MKKKWFMTKWIWALVAIAIASGGYYYKIQSSNKQVEAVVVINEVNAEKGDIKISLESDGQASIAYTNLDFEVSGKLTKLYVKVGDRIKKGQKLAEIDKDSYEKAYETAKLSYDKAVLNYKSKQQSQGLDNTAAKQKIEDYRIKAEQLEKDYKTMLQIKDSYAVSEIEAKKAEMETAQRTYNNEKSNYQVTGNSTIALSIEQLNVETAKLQLETAKENLDKTVLYAAIDGLILKADYAVGDQVAPMTDSGSLTASTNHFIVATAAKNYEVNTSVSEQDLSMVSVGQPVEVVFDAIAGETYTGKVSAISALPNTESNGVVSYDVTVLLDNGFDTIKIGMTAQLELILKQEKDVIVIPNKAVTMVEGQQQVKVKKSDGTLEMRSIEAGLTDGRQVGVHKGLEVGEVVVYETTGK